MQLLSKSFLLLFSFTLISCSPQVKIKIISENENLPAEITDMTLANYGYVPYGQTIYSQVRVANPLNGCSSIEASEEDLYYQIIIMLRGDCTFLQKTKQAELSGAKLLIIVDNRNEEEDEIVMVADHSSAAHIPTIMIDKKDGDPLIKAAREEGIVISVTFPKPEEQDTAYIDFWLDSYDLSSYEFLSFASLNSSLSDLLSTKQVIFTPHYVIWYCAHCQELDYKLSDSDWSELSEYCLYQGRYCNPDPDRTEFSDGPIKGVNVVEEDWRQIYSLEACSEDIMQQVGINKKLIKECQNINIRNPEKDNSIVDNLEKQKIKFIDEEIMIWPSLFINNLTYRGELESNETIDTICQALKSDKKPDLCKNFNSLKSGKQLGSNKLLSCKLLIITNELLIGGIVLISLLFVALFMIIFYYLYQRQIRKQVDKEIQIQVNSSVAQYFALQVLISFLFFIFCLKEQKK